MAIENPNAIHAAARYDGITDTILVNSGFHSIVKNGVGLYIFMLENRVNGLPFISKENAIGASFVDAVPAAAINSDGSFISVTITNSAANPGDDIVNLWVLAPPQN